VKGTFESEPAAQRNVYIAASAVSSVYVRRYICAALEFLMQSGAHLHAALVKTDPVSNGAL
jgi:hypothetical protein